MQMNNSSDSGGGGAIAVDRARGHAARQAPDGASQVIAWFAARPPAMRLTVVTLLSLGIWALIAKGVVEAIG